MMEPEPTIIASAVTHGAEEEENLLGWHPRRRERLEFALPTINIIFLLMLYFLVAGTIVQRDELSVAPPETTQVPTDRLPRPLLLITNTGEFVLDGVSLTQAQLVPAALAAVAADVAQGRPLNVLAPGGMAAGPFLEVLAGLAAANVPVKVVTVEKAEPGAAP